MSIHKYNTAVIGDLHLSDAEPVHPKKPYWKNFKQAKHFIDESFEGFLAHLESESDLPVELILNGDIFDYDSVMSLPEGELYEELSHMEKKIGVDVEVKSENKHEEEEVEVEVEVVAGGRWTDVGTVGFGTRAELRTRGGQRQCRGRGRGGAARGGPAVVHGSPGLRRDAVLSADPCR